MRILVVGASGHIGGRVVPLLAARGTKSSWRACRDDRGDHRELSFRGGPDGTPMSPSPLPPTVREFEVARR